MGHGKRKRAQLTTTPTSASPTRAPRRLTDEEIVNWVRRPGQRSFRYRPNVAGFWIAVVFALFVFASGYAMIHFTGLHAIADKISFVIALAVGIYTVSSAFAGFRSSIRSYIVLGNDELLVGEGPRAWALPLERLTRHTLRFDRMDARRYSSSLPVEMDDVRIHIHIAGAFSILREPQGFIAQLLEIMLANEERDGIADPYADEGST